MSQTQTEKLAMANQYFSHRMAENHDEILKLCHDQVVVQSERDGRYEGKDQVRNYLEQKKPTGKWGEAKVNSEGAVYIPGVVNIMWMDWNVVGVFDFCQETGLISKIELKRGKYD